jgi:hypothetical protein
MSLYTCESGTTWDDEAHTDCPCCRGGTLLEPYVDHNSIRISELERQLATAQERERVLRAALERATDAAKSYRSDILGHSAQQLGPYFPEMNHAPKWCDRDNSIAMADAALSNTEQ